PECSPTSASSCLAPRPFFSRRAAATTPVPLCQRPCRWRSPVRNEPPHCLNPCADGTRSHPSWSGGDIVVRLLDLGTVLDCDRPSVLDEPVPEDRAFGAGLDHYGIIAIVSNHVTFHPHVGLARDGDPVVVVAHFAVDQLALGIHERHAGGFAVAQQALFDTDRFRLLDVEEAAGADVREEDA